MPACQKGSGWQGTVVCCNSERGMVYLKYTRSRFPPQYDVHMPLTGVTSLEDMMKYSPVSGSSGREPWVIYSEGRQG